MAGCVPSKHKALGFIPSTGINLVGWRRPVIPALRKRLSFSPEITQLVRSKDRSQRALSWVPHVIPSRQLLGWRTERAGKDVEKGRKGESMGSRCKHEAQSWRPEPGGASKAWGTMCV